jgi:Diadenosine tetraphosphate (Ap4A) hydrolase and other HIT family hydrolases
MSQKENSCIFCAKQNCKVIEEKKYFFVIRDTAYPVTKHHTLIISNRHIDDYFKLNSEELSELSKILIEQKEKLISLDSSITGFNIGVNIGKDAGQSIMHCHIHLIPRRKGD